MSVFTRNKIFGKQSKERESGDTFVATVFQRGVTFHVAGVYNAGAAKRASAVPLKLGLCVLLPIKAETLNERQMMG